VSGRHRLVALAIVLALVGCRTPTPPTPAPAASAGGMAGTSWVVEQIDGADPVERASLDVDGTGTRVSGRTGCNRYTARLSVAGETLRVDQGATTKMACPAPAMDQERRFLGALGAVRAARREGHRLLLLDESGRVRLRLAPAPGGAGAVLRARVYECDGGETLTAAFPADADAVDMTLPGGRRRLPHVLAASGARYGDGQVTFWSKGSEAILERDGRTWQCREHRLRSILEDARLRGVVVRATGNEPFWLLEILGDRIVFAPGLQGDRVVTPRPRATRDAATGETVYIAATEAHRLVVRLAPGGCVDSMSGQRFDQAAAVQLDGRAFRGCAQALAGDP
jgi:heat shock protein HslJ/uncharacterized membrane protein/membrane-bound inhibitor of C-type lysozyme